MRSLARESVFKYLFSRLFNPCDEGLFDVLIKDLKENDKVFAKKLLECVLANEEKYLNILADLSVGYSLDRIHKADKCIILLGFAEFDNFKETDVPVIVDEAVKLASIYCADRSTDFINGILAEYLRRG